MNGGALWLRARSVWLHLAPIELQLCRPLDLSSLKDCKRSSRALRRRSSRWTVTSHSRSWIWAKKIRVSWPRTSTSSSTAPPPSASTSLSSEFLGCTAPFFFSFFPLPNSAGTQAYLRLGSLCASVRYARTPTTTLSQQRDVLLVPPVCLIFNALKMRLWPNKAFFFSLLPFSYPLRPSIRVKASAFSHPVLADLSVKGGYCVKSFNC